MAASSSLAGSSTSSFRADGSPGPSLTANNTLQSSGSNTPTTSVDSSSTGATNAQNAGTTDSTNYQGTHAQTPFPPTSASATSSSSHFSSPQKSTVSQSGTHGVTSSHVQSTSPAPNSTATFHPSPPTDHRLNNGAVAGIVIGVAVGLSLITFLITFLIMRHKQSPKDNLSNGRARELGVPGPGGPSQKEEKVATINEDWGRSTPTEHYLPQTADDMAIQSRARTTLDQIELHVENFYQENAVSSAVIVHADMAIFDSPYLPSSLSVLLPQSKNKVLLIKHILAHLVLSCTSATASPERCVLPPDFALLPSLIKSSNSTASFKPGFSQCFSRWRTLTAYLRPEPSLDSIYLAQRDETINRIAHAFSQAFSPWKNPRYRDEDRIGSISAILREAAGLGVWMFSQPCELEFRWPKPREVGSNRVVVAPSLVKLTNEKGAPLEEPQIMVRAVLLKV